MLEVALLVRNFNYMKVIMQLLVACSLCVELVGSFEII